jgi:hypothetical protein
MFFFVETEKSLTFQSADFGLTGRRTTSICRSTTPSQMRQKPAVFLLVYLETLFYKYSRDDYRNYSDNAD